MKNVGLAIVITLTVALLMVGGQGLNVTSAHASDPVSGLAAEDVSGGVPESTVSQLPAWPLLISADMAANNRETIIAVLDSGIDMNHTDLKDRIVGSVNFTGSQTEFDQQSHGTHVAGIIAADADSAAGVAGVNPLGKLLNVKVVEDNGMVWPSNAAKGIIWAVDHGARVINMSFTLSGDSKALADAVEYASGHDVVMIAAAGNKLKSATYPAAYSGVIAVAALNPDGTVWSGSRDSDKIDAYAPGVDILSTAPGNKFSSKTGSSMAAAYASGLTAMLLNSITDSNGDGRLSDDLRTALGKLVCPVK